MQRVEQDRKKLSPTERKWQKLASKISHRGWVRAFAALSAMTPVERDLIRQTLRFRWSAETRDCQDEAMRAELESWEIIDCHIRGIAGRLHSLAEQMNPARYITWREALIRILDMLNLTYRATDPEESLEKAVLTALIAEKRVSERGQTEMPTLTIGKMGKMGGIVISVLKDVAAMWDHLLGSEESPAVATVFAICEAIQTKSV